MHNNARFSILISASPRTTNLKTLSQSQIFATSTKISIHSKALKILAIGIHELENFLCPQNDWPKLFECSCFSNIHIRRLIKKYIFIILCSNYKNTELIMMRLLDLLIVHSRSTKTPRLSPDGSYFTRFSLR